MNLSLVLNQMIILLILMVIGFISKKLHILDDAGNSAISKLVINVSCPALILNSVFSEAQIRDRGTLKLLFIVATAFFIFSFIISKIIVYVFKVNKSSRHSFEFLASFGNISFVGIPVLKAVFPEQQTTVILYQSVFLIFFNLFIFTYGAFLLGRDYTGEKPKINFAGIFNIGTLASISAVVLYFFRFQPPAIVNNTLGMIGNTTTPLAMILIGSTIASYPLKNFFKGGRIYGLAFVKLIFIPLAVWGLSGSFIHDFLVRGVLTVLASMPSGIMAIMLANQYGGDKEFISRSVFFTTVCSVVTVPLIAYLIHNF